MTMQKLALIIFAIAIITGMASVLSYGAEMSGTGAVQVEIE